MLDNNNTTGEGGGEGLEDKAKIIKRLRKLLKATRAGREIIDMHLVLDGNKETVEITFENGSKEVDITADSGIAIIKDVVGRL